MNEVQDYLMSENLSGLVIYQLRIDRFTEQGTLKAAKTRRIRCTTAAIPSVLPETGGYLSAGGSVLSLKPMSRSLSSRGKRLPSRFKTGKRRGS